MKRKFIIEIEVENNDEDAEVGNDIKILCEFLKKHHINSTFITNASSIKSTNGFILSVGSYCIKFIQKYDSVRVIEVNESGLAIPAGNIFDILETGIERHSGYSGNIHRDSNGLIHIRR